MASIDRPSVFLGTITESTLGTTAKGGFPQWVARLLADKKYVSEKAEMEHFNITEPGYVAWPYDESIVAYMVLFNDNGPLKNYEQIQTATGWTGQDFADLVGLVGKRILFRVEQEEYNGQTQLKVKWIDAEDAPPERTLKPADASQIKSLNQKFLVGLKKPAAPAKPIAAKPSQAVPVGKPADGAAAIAATAAPSAASTSGGQTTAPAVPTTPEVTAPNAGASASPSASPAPAAGGAVKPPTRKPKAPAADPAPARVLPPSITKEAAWEYLVDPAVRGASSETHVADAWGAACYAVGPDKDEDHFTGEDWAKVRDVVLTTLIK